MLRKLNFTERIRIPRSEVHISLRRELDGVLAFDASIAHLMDLDAPASTRVYIEARDSTSFMRFDCGSLDSLSIPSDRRLTDINGSSVRFRIKLVGSQHRILAVAEDIRVTENAPGQGTSMPLLPVQFSSELGQQAWRVAFESDTPVLELNNGIDGIQRIAREDPLFFALVYPAAVREVLTHILLVDRHDPFEGGDDWWSHWLRWAEKFNPDPRPSNPEDAARWIDDVGAAFCSRYSAVEKFNARKEV